MAILVAWYQPAGYQGILYKIVSNSISIDHIMSHAGKCPDTVPTWNVYWPIDHEKIEINNNFNRFVLDWGYIIVIYSNTI